VLGRFASTAQPPVLGTLLPGPSPDGPIVRAIFKMFGGRPPKSDGNDVVTGLARSAGVARECSIPAVDGTKQATGAIRTGDEVEVNGDEGTVRVLSRR